MSVHVRPEQCMECLLTLPSQEEVARKVFVLRVRLDYLVAPGSSNDPADTDNSAWNTSAYAAQATNNKTAGVQFTVSTVGYSI